MERIEKLLNEFTKKLNEDSRNVPYNFNVLDEQCGHIVENSHTNILMKILQYKNHYGYVFLENFFTYLGISITLEKKDIRFERERFTKGEKKKGRIDGYIYQEGVFALIIENKVNHAYPTEDQIKTYIEGIKRDISPDKIWVIYLTEDGNSKEGPDTESINKMRSCGILDKAENNNNDSEEISGPRYFAINYQDHILPWLKEEIQPIVMQREQVLNTGLLQYIDFLEGMLGIRKQDLELMEKSKEWLHSHNEIKAIPDDNFLKRNNELQIIYNELNEELKKIKKKDDVKSKKQYYAAIILKNLIEKINEEPLQDFFDITRDYFVSKGLMEECVIHPVFNFKYIQIRDSNWPRSIHFEWYPLGVDKLTRMTEYVFCFHVECKQEKRVKFEKLTDMFKNAGFERTDTSRLSYIKIVKYSNNPKSIIKMGKDELTDFLVNNVYKSITKEIIDSINNVINVIK